MVAERLQAMPWVQNGNSRVAFRAKTIFVRTVPPLVRQPSRHLHRPTTYSTFGREHHVMIDMVELTCARTPTPQPSSCGNLGALRDARQARPDRPPASDPLERGHPPVARQELWAAYELASRTTGSLTVEGPVLRRVRLLHRRQRLLFTDDARCQSLFELNQSGWTRDRQVCRPMGRPRVPPSLLMHPFRQTHVFNDGTRTFRSGTAVPAANMPRNGWLIFNCDPNSLVLPAARADRPRPRGTDRSWSPDADGSTSNFDTTRPATRADRHGRGHDRDLRIPASAGYLFRRSGV